MDKISRNQINFLIKPVLFMVVVVAMFVTVSAFGYSQIRGLFTKTNESKKNISSLNNKISILESVSTVIAGDTTFLDIVIPSASSSLYAISQIKNQALLNNLLVANIKAGNPVPSVSNVTKTIISFDLEGEPESTYNYLRSFKKMLPLMSLEKVKISSVDGIYKTNVSLAVYTSDLPKKIPSITSDANKLTDTELNILKELVNYTLPIFIKPSPSEVDTPKEDPFN